MSILTFLFGVIGVLLVILNFALLAIISNEHDIWHRQNESGLWFLIRGSVEMWLIGLRGGYSILHGIFAWLFVAPEDR